MARDRVLLRGGTILTMDPAIGTLQVGDVLIEEGRIIAVAPKVAADDAEIIDAHGHIVAPGMIDTHRHTWQTQLRALCADWTLADYLFGIRFAISPTYQPGDVFLGNRLGAIDALNSGVTTVLDFSHCNNTPDHADAAVAGLRDAGIRAIFGYGFFESSPLAPPHFAEHAQRIEDFHRIADGEFSSANGLVTLGAALTEPGILPLAATRGEVSAARARGAVVVTHTGCVWSLPSGIAELDAAGLIGPEQVHVHCNALNDREWEILARRGAKLSISVETELNMGMGRPVFATAMRHGIKPTLSCDIISLNSGDLFSQLRLGVAFIRWADTEALNLAGGDPEAVSVTALDALQWVTTNAAEAVGLNDRIGTLTPGKQADVIVVGGPGISQHPRLDPAGTLIFQTSPDDVRDVMVGGRFAKRDHQMSGVDMVRLAADAETSAADVLDRVRSNGVQLPGTPPDPWALLGSMTIKNLAAS
jgi:cytosine/adenosine deaminase-related metal-dependent hydrolase